MDDRQPIRVAALDATHLGPRESHGYSEGDLADAGHPPSGTDLRTDHAVDLLATTPGGRQARITDRHGDSLGIVPYRPITRR